MLSIVGLDIATRHRIFGFANFWQCDEVHPACTNCQRHQTSCTWGRSPAELKSPIAPDLSNLKISDHRARPLPHNNSTTLPRRPEIPESKSRRLSELRLLHHYMTDTSYSIILPDDRSSDWAALTPPVAFKHESLLYGIYAVTSLHLSRLHPNEPNHFITYEDYLGPCLIIHRDNVATLNAENADAAMLTASMLRCCSLAMLQVRNLEKDGKYVPPVEWLTLNFGTGHGLAVATWKFLMHDETSVIRRMIGNDTPGLDPMNPFLRDERLLDRNNITPTLSRLLHRTKENEADEPWDEDIKNAYESTLAYIGSCQHAMSTDEPRPQILRMLVLFPTLIERKFITLVEQEKDRALTVLAYYFSLWKGFEGVWWCGEVGKREMTALTKALKAEWRDLLNSLIAFEVV